MIKRLRLKFIMLSMAALFVLLALVVTGMNVINYRQIVADADGMLRLIAENGGIFPEIPPDMKNAGRLPLSPEAPFETRYFSVVFDSEENLLFADTSRITAVGPEQAAEYAVEVLRSNTQNGFIGKYRYLRQGDKILTRIIFLNCGRELDSFNSFLAASITMAVAGYAGFFIVLLLFSKRIAAPVAESYEKQKRFITDAGHEIKTPLTIIKANTDVIKEEYGESEWLADIKIQTDRLVSLTDNLVRLARMEESSDSMSVIEFPLSDIVNDIAASFATVAKIQGKDFSFEVQGGIEMRGNEKSVIELTEILLDNAVKYTPDGGRIFLTLGKKRKHIILTVKNDTEQRIPDDKRKLIFERFYRLDQSRNSETGGHGIGLSIAKAIAEAHGGKIFALTDADGMLEITVLLG